MSRAASPVVLLAFADPRRDLMNLKAESSGIRDIFWRADEGAEVVILEHPTLEQIIGTFQRYRDRVAIFHYGGHASGFALLLETVTGDSHLAGAAGLAAFLGLQQGLHVVFLNGCSTRAQVDGLLAAGISCVIATTRAIDDAVATWFAKQFYESLTSGGNIQRAFQEASAAAKSQHGDQTRLLVAVDADADQEPITLELPWELHPARPESVEWTFSRESRRRRRAASGASPKETASLKQLQILLSRVREFWVDGYLRNTSKRGELIKLRTESRPDLIEQPWDTVVSAQSKHLESPENNQSILDLFDESEQSLLILGHPGSGKTTTLLELTRRLVERAESEPQQPVPVVFHLSTWNSEFDSLAFWMERELNDKYQVPKRIGGSWIEEQRLILVLDGLDEVAEEFRQSCVQAIHSFLADIGAPGIAICCRLHDYLAIGTRLKLGDAVCLQPLSDSQILEQASCEGDGDVLRRLLETHSPLRELAHSPLMLGIMRDTYQGNVQIDPLTLQSMEQCQDHLFASYIEQMFRQRPKGAEIPQARMLAWLHRLAQMMNGTGRSMFLIEELQPDILKSRRWLSIYQLGVVLVLGLSCGGMTSLFWRSLGSVSTDARTRTELGLTWWMTGTFIIWFSLIAISESFPWTRKRELATSPRRIVLQGALNFVVFAALWGVAMIPAVLWSAQRGEISLLSPLLMTGTLGAVLFGTYSCQRRMILDITFVESLGYSISRSLWGSLGGAIGGLGIWLAYLSWGETRIAFRWQGPSTPQTGATVFLVTFLVLGIESGVILGGLAPRVMDRKTRPNEGLRLSLRNSMKLGTLVGATFAFTICSILSVIHVNDAKYSQLSSGFLFAIVCGLSTWFAIALWFGLLEVGKHGVLRLTLAAAGQFPLRLVQALRAACRLRFLQRAGGGFLFLHRLLQEFFEKIEPPAEPATSPEGITSRHP